MTDEQIIKALECCTSDDEKDCTFNCPYKGNMNLCVNDLPKNALDLINRQKDELAKKNTEIDILIRKKEILQDEICELQADNAALKDALHNAHLDMKALQEEMRRLL